MHKIKHFITVLLLFTAASTYAQMGTPVDSATVAKVMAKCATKFPKFYREFNAIKAEDKLIKNFIFERNEHDAGPAHAGPRGNVFIDIKYLETQQPDFGDDRLIVVLYHEIGHLHYFMNVPQPQRTPDASEQAAFEYSLLKTKEIAEKGDCLPLKTGLKFMKIRSEANNLQDPHVVALKRIVTEPLYASYKKYVSEKCP